MRRLVQTENVLGIISRARGRAGLREVGSDSPVGRSGTKAPRRGQGTMVLLVRFSYEDRIRSRSTIVAERPRTDGHGRVCAGSQADSPVRKPVPPSVVEERRQAARGAS